MICPFELSHHHHHHHHILTICEIIFFVGRLRRRHRHFCEGKSLRGVCFQQPFQENQKVRSVCAGEALVWHTCCARNRSQRAMGSNASDENRSQSSAVSHRREAKGRRLAGCEWHAVQVLCVFRLLRSTRRSNDTGDRSNQDARAGKGLVPDVVSSRRQQHEVPLDFRHGSRQSHPRELESQILGLLHPLPASNLLS